MSKRNVAFNKPEEPAFLKRIKQEIGYKEGPSVDTKRQELDNFSDDEESAGNSREEEQPQVVVLKEGDLTAEQAEIEQKRIEKEESEKKADLTQKIIFKGKSKKNPTPEEIKIKEKSKKSKEKPSKLSFNEDDEEEEANY